MAMLNKQMVYHSAHAHWPASKPCLAVIFFGNLCGEACPATTATAFRSRAAWNSACGWWMRWRKCIKRCAREGHGWTFNPSMMVEQFRGVNRHPFQFRRFTFIAMFRCILIFRPIGGVITTLSCWEAQILEHSWAKVPLPVSRLRWFRRVWSTGFCFVMGAPIHPNQTMYPKIWSMSPADPIHDPRIAIQRIIEWANALVPPTPFHLEFW